MKLVFVLACTALLGACASDSSRHPGDVYGGYYGGSGYYGGDRGQFRDSIGSGGAADASRGSDDGFQGTIGNGRGGGNAGPGGRR
jgi:hypothetical protein